MPAREEIPSTLRRSSKEAQETWIKAHDSAVESYGEGRRAHQTAYSALKHKYEKLGDRWMPKQRKGPSDEQAKRGAGQPEMPTSGGVDEKASKKHLYDRARELDISGRSKMTKSQLVDALRGESGRETKRARS
ncbi:ChaB family protein [Saccharopolyspora phatthalungensis]|uniref:Cation transport regulator ChaB n=1 Tax=Saccharopolyspora phatthalungensis TaxID=664693 RepID=A0A840QEK2_9PSEU|nr:ChaB family protein [Saccharopolyspora phatthalungensis]MBB5156915.1 cation transport regulator ChaB [Saccharopolyspora phatthalungensis]